MKFNKGDFCISNDSSGSKGMVIYIDYIKDTFYVCKVLARGTYPSMMPEIEFTIDYTDLTYDRLSAEESKLWGLLFI